MELDFDAVAAARMAKLTEANQGRALAVVFDHTVVQAQVIDRKLSDKVVISGKDLSEKLVAGFARSLRECMMEPAAAATSFNSKDPSAVDVTADAELKAVEHPTAAGRGGPSWRTLGR